MRLLAISLAFGLACSSAALAQTNSNSTTCARTQSLANQGSQPSTSMADSSSDMGNKGSGASSASIATGPTDKTGVMTPCAPGTTGQSTTGALPGTPAKPYTP